MDNFLEVSSYDDGKSCFDLSCTMALFLVKRYFLCFNYIIVLYIKPIWINFEDKDFEG